MQQDRALAFRPVALLRALSALVIAFAALLAVPALNGTAHAATLINCDTAAQPSADWSTCQQLVGTAACAWDNGDGTWTVALGYQNPTAYDLYAAAPVGGTGGTNNALQANGGSAADPAHVSTFWSGGSSTAFTVTWTPTRRLPAVTWSLMGNTYRFTTGTQPLCTSKPVPIMGNMTVIWIALGLFVAAFAVVNRRRLRQLRDAPWLHRPPARPSA